VPALPLGRCRLGRCARHGHHLQLHHRAPAGPAFKADAPYVVAVIDLDEGARMMTNIVTGDVEAVRIGQRVTVHYDDVTDEVTLPKFRLL